MTSRLWFPAFKLRENPFKYSDAVVELSVPTVPSIEGDFLIRIGSFLGGGVSCIVVGNRGVGKSRLAAQLRSKGETVLFSKSDWETRDIEVGEKKVQAFGETKTEEIVETVQVFPTKTQVVVDLPDDLDRKQVRDWVSAIRTRMRTHLTTIILLCNDEQYNVLRRFDAIARLPRIDFPRADKKFLTQLYNDRIKAFGEPGFVSPFRPEVVDRLTELSDTPRAFLQLCSLVLTRMWIDNLREEVKEACGLDYIDGIEELKEVKDLKVARNENQLLRTVVDALRKEGRVWVSAQELVRILLEEQRLSMTSERLGRLMKGLGYTRRYNPDAEYRLN